MSQALTWMCKRYFEYGSHQRANILYKSTIVGTVGGGFSSGLFWAMDHIKKTRFHTPDAPYTTLFGIGINRGLTGAYLGAQCGIFFGAGFGASLAAPEVAGFAAFALWATKQSTSKPQVK